MLQGMIARGFAGAVSSSPPSYFAAGTGSGSPAANTVSPGLPASVTSSMALVAIVLCWDGFGTTHTTGTSGWTKVAEVGRTTGQITMSVWIAQGGAAAPTFNVSGVGAACQAQIIAYSNGNGASYGAVSTNEGMGTTQTTSALTSTQDNSLIFLVD